MWLYSRHCMLIASGNILSSFVSRVSSSGGALVELFLPDSAVLQIDEYVRFRKHGLCSEILTVKLLKHIPCTYEVCFEVFHVYLFLMFIFYVGGRLVKKSYRKEFIFLLLKKR